MSACGEVDADLEALHASGLYSCECHLKEPTGTVIDFLASSAQGPIYPKEVVDEAGKDQIKRFVGTELSQFVEYLPDRHTRFKRSRTITHPTEIVSLAFMLAIKGVGNRLFYRWLEQDGKAGFPICQNALACFDCSKLSVIGLSVSWQNQPALV